MAIATGTTARNLTALGRWGLVSLMIVGMLTWSRPGFTAWGAMSASLLVVAVLWLCSRILSGETTIPGHPLHWALLGPSAVLAWHLAKDGLGRGSVEPGATAGAMVISILFFLALLSLGALLTQSLLPRAAHHSGVMAICGAVMMGGPLAAMALGHSPVARTAMGLLALAGAGVWLCPLWGLADDSEQAHPLRRPGLRAVVLAIAAGAAGGVVWLAPTAGCVGVGMVAIVALMSGLLHRQRRITMLLTGGSLLAASIIGMCRSGMIAAWLLDWARLTANSPSLLGGGDEGFCRSGNADSGVVVLAATVGWAGIAWLLGGLAVAALWMMARARGGRPSDHARAVLWTAVAALTFLALLSPGGLYVPAVAMGCMFAWGLLPAMLGHSHRTTSGWALLAVMTAIMLLMGIARQDGLVGWAADSLGANDKAMHCVTGLLVSLVAAWLCGRKAVWRGLLGLLAAALSGGAGELAQQTLSSRGGEWGDWLAHLAGSAAAAILYLLSVGAAGCESRHVVDLSTARAKYAPAGK